MKHGVRPGLIARAALPFAVGATILGKAHHRVAQRRPVDLHLRNAVADAVRILDRYDERARGPPDPGLGAAPVGRDARIEAHASSDAADAEKALDPEPPVHAAAPVYQVQPPRPTWGGTPATSAART